MISLTLLLLPLLAAHGDPLPASPSLWTGGSLGLANPALSAPVQSSPWDWLDPSRGLSRLLEGQKNGLDLLQADLLVRGAYARVENDIEDTLASDDFTDFNLIDADLALTLFEGSWSGRVGVDFSGEGPGNDGPSLEDAYLRWTDRNWGEVTVGRFKPYMTRSSEVDPEYLLFPTRTFVGSAFDRWDEGIEWHSTRDEFDVWLSATNRENSLTEENVYAARGEWAFYDAWWEPRESAKDAPNHLRLILGATYVNDNEEDEPGDQKIFAFDMHGTLGPYSLLAEWVDLGSGQSLRPSEEADYPLVTELGNNPWSITLGRMLGEQWQVGFRAQDARDTNSTKSMGLALNWFPVDAPLVFFGELTDIDQDSGTEQSGLLLRVGFSIGLTRHDQPSRLR